MGLLYASLLLISWCPRIWSIQFTFTPAASKFVWRYFLRLCAVMFGSSTLRNALRISDEKEPRGMRLTAPVFHVRKSGLLSVIFSGGTRRLPCCLSSRYFLIAWIASDPMNVFAVSFVFCVILVIAMKSAPLLICSAKSPTFISRASLILSPESLRNRIDAFIISLLRVCLWSKVLRIASLFATLTPKLSPFG